MKKTFELKIYKTKDLFGQSYYQLNIFSPGGGLFMQSKWYRDKRHIKNYLESQGYYTFPEIVEVE